MADVEHSLQAAKAALESKDYKTALAHVQTALKTDPKSYDALVTAGEVASAAGRGDQALEAYRRATAAAPERSEAWEALAQLGKDQKNEELIIEANQKLLGLLPKDAAGKLFDAHAALAQVLKARGDWSAAATHVSHQLSVGDLFPDERLELQCQQADLELQAHESRVDELVQERLAAALAATESRPDCVDAMAAPPPSAEALRRDVLVELALAEEEMQERGRAACEQPGPDAAALAGGTPLLDALRAICASAPLAAKYTRYFDELLRRSLRRVFTAPPRSAERQAARRAALRECWALTCPAGAGGSSALPFESAIWLLEEEEEVKGGTAAPVHPTVAMADELGGTGLVGAGGIGSGPIPVPGWVSPRGGAEAGTPDASAGHDAALSQVMVTALENFARRFMHRFPDNPNARACLALMLRRRSVGDGTVAVPQSTRRELAALLRGAARDPDRLVCATAWKALAELEYENREYEAARGAALRGLHWLAARREAGHEALAQVALGLRLVLAKALRRLGRLDEAEAHFRVLAGWVTEGEPAFAALSGTSPVSVHQQALRGLALVALARGERDAGKAQYERILGKAAMGRGPGEHWAHADYGWLLFEDGDLHGAREHLEAAVRAAREPGVYVTDSQLGEHHARLGEVYWAMRGRYRRERQYAYHEFLEAARAEGHFQGKALAGLGRYFLEIEQAQEQAARCFKKALALDPTVDTAGVPEAVLRAAREPGHQL